ncbi:MAG: isopentenyl-diphosphate Delta-isomerase [Lachnospiraceae bacterium]|nr:isopentenyl-diphosphate Delta-isomerase [Lachnospiraceae bacterium]
MSDDLILVDLNDTQIGTGEKLWVHQNDRLHRAFSVFLISGDGQRMLLQKRARGKYHSGGLWANACCSHPRNGEVLEEAVERRLAEELGIAADVTERFHFVYRACFENGLTEYEYDHVFLGRFDGEVRPSEEEIEETAWVGIEELKKEVVENPKKFAAWFLIALPRVLEELEG